MAPQSLTLAAIAISKLIARIAVDPLAKRIVLIFLYNFLVICS